MNSRYPPGMSQRDFDRATADETESCRHGLWSPECPHCEEDALLDAADRKRDELRDQER